MKEWQGSSLILAEDRKKIEKAYAIGLLAGRETHLARLCFADAAKAGRQLSEAQSFWQ
jgi:hypothetical protein